MKSRFLILSVLLVLITGCASTPSGEKPGLYLPSILTDAETKAAEKRAQERTKAQAEQDWEQNVREQASSSTLDPPELELLELPSNFIKLSPEEINSLRKEQNIPSFAQLIWRDDQTQITVMLGKVDINSDSLTAMSKEQLKTELMRISTVYEDIYKTKPVADTKRNIDYSPSLAKLSIETRYLDGNVYFTDLRYFYIYDITFRLNLLVNGPSDNLLLLRPAVNKALQDFESKLKALHQDEIPLKAEVPAYYAVNNYKVIYQSGEEFHMQVLTKVFEQSKCDEIGQKKNRAIGYWRPVDYYCVQGKDVASPDAAFMKTYDDQYRWMFSKKEGEKFYLAIVDEYGYQTRIHFQDAPISFASPASREVVKFLQKMGVRDYDYMYPNPSRQ